MIPGERDINDSAALLLFVLGLCFGALKRATEERAG